MKPIESNPAQRIRKQYRNENLYVMLNFDDKGILTDIDLSQSSDTLDTQETLSGLAIVANLVNALIGMGELDKVIGIASGASMGPRTLPGIILEVLTNYQKEGNHENNNRP